MTMSVFKAMSVAPRAWPFQVRLITTIFCFLLCCVVVVPGMLLIHLGSIAALFCLYSTTQKEIKISAALDASQGSKSPGMVRVSVKDSGPGIPASEAALLFEKFVRLKRDLSGSTPGTGLGLYICKQLVEAMGGRIWVESAGIAEQGSCFSFTLPRALSEKAQVSPSSDGVQRALP